jgi:hypothetical protein
MASPLSHMVSESPVGEAFSSSLQMSSPALGNLFLR